MKSHASNTTILMSLLLSFRPAIVLRCVLFPSLLIGQLRRGGWQTFSFYPPSTLSAFVARFLFIFTATPFNLSTLSVDIMQITLCAFSALVFCSYCHLPAEFITTSFISYVLVPVANILNRLKKKNPDFGGNFFFFPPQSSPSSSNFLRT